MERAYDKPEATAFHEWRKHVKDLGYQMQILRNLWPAVFKRVRGELDTLGDLLGKEHDLTVMRDVIVKNAHVAIVQEDLQAFLALTEEREFQLSRRPKRSDDEFMLKGQGISSGEFLLTGKLAGGSSGSEKCRH